MQRKKRLMNRARMHNRKRVVLPAYENPGVDCGAWRLHFLVNMTAGGIESIQLLQMLVEQLSEGQFRRMCAQLKLSAPVEDVDLFSRRRRNNAVPQSLDQIPRREFERDLDEQDDARGYVSGGTRAIRDAVLATLSEDMERFSGRLEHNLYLLEELQELFQLSDDEALFVLFGYILQQSSDLERLLNHQDDYESAIMVAAALEIPLSRVRSLCSAQGRLILMGLLEERHRRFGGVAPPVEEVAEHLSGVKEVPLQDRVVERVDTPGYPLDSFGIAPRRIALLQGLLAQQEGNSSILLYGKPGTGKTELAKALVNSTGKPCFFLRRDKAEHSHGRSWRMRLELGMRRAESEQGVLVIDEADTLLNTEGGGFAGLFLSRAAGGEDKGWLNDYLDRSGVPLIWVSNRVSGMHSSVQRRFSYSLEFHDCDLNRRTVIWKTLLQKSPLRTAVKPPLYRRLAAEFPVNAGGVALALQETAALTAAEESVTAERAEQVLRELLERQLALSGIPRGSTLTLPDKNYDPGVLRLDCSADAVVEAVKQFGKFQELRGTSRLRSLNLLFWGPSGTGKTAFAKYLAAESGRELLVKRASDLIDPYVGMTEKKIARMFRQAEEGNRLLFVDEADSFLYSRSGAQRSWELSHVNEFLTQMENFHGILICCTNLLDRFDHASLRRFQWKVGFRPLDAAGRQTLFRSFFKIKGQLPKVVRQRLDRMEGLVPGDFRAVDDRFGFYAAEERSAGRLLDALEVELNHRKKQREIGFA